VACASSISWAVAEFFSFSPRTRSNEARASVSAAVGRLVLGLRGFEPERRAGRGRRGPRRVRLQFATVEHDQYLAAPYPVARLHSDLGHRRDHPARDHRQVTSADDTAGFVEHRPLDGGRRGGGHRNGHTRGSRGVVRRLAAAGGKGDDADGGEPGSRGRHMANHVTVSSRRRGRVPRAR
jgi:hypothetical protein